MSMEHTSIHLHPDERASIALHRALPSVNAHSLGVWIDDSPWPIVTVFFNAKTAEGLAASLEKAAANVRAAYPAPTEVPS